MKFFKNFDWSAKSIAKVIGVVFLGIIALAIAVALISFSFRTIFGISQQDYYEKNVGMGGYAPAMDMAMESAYYGGEARVSSAIIPSPGYSTGTDAEAYEVTTYSGTIKTRKLDKTCDTIANLKIKDYIIFEDSNKNDDACYYRFKVSKENTEEVVKVIEDLKPEILNVNIQSIKGQVEGVEDELEILKKKLASVEETLTGAQSAYDEISKLATQKQDAETLAKIIDSKLNLIERLSTQRLQIKEQIDRYSEMKSDQLDRLNYTFFDINVYKDLIFDWKEIKDSWKYEARAMVSNINAVFQGISLNLVTYLVRFAQVVLYLFISIFLLRFVWIGVKRIWKGEFKGKKRK
ncbi:hypothetical protein KJ657_00895 [Patescibacteria group bacterium]|nr:hypothetical protein [Patescibacteria group bacterium]MBU1015628.1 hypothetical protein [Patescibacteria group bacterium]MBU1684995.1 hypothetical protein [Patescibacteria group bacterium]MBU1938537.1 hypothetical protein [Patescibacteria group bacterium]